MTSRGLEVSGLFIFAQSLLTALETHKPAYVVVAFDAKGPTRRRQEYVEDKAQREAMPEGIVESLPLARRLLRAMNIQAVEVTGYEADDIIGTLTKSAESNGIDCLMLSPDKDLGQLVSDKTRLVKPTKTGDAEEIVGLPELRARWGIQRPEQLTDILGLMGDASDNIPGVPGVGEKTAIKLIAEYGNIENLLTQLDKLKGRLQENLQTFQEQALLSKRLATIDRHVPFEVSWESFKCQSPKETELRKFLAEMEFTSISKRLFASGISQQTSQPAVDIQAEPLSEDSAKAALTPYSSVEHDYKIVVAKAERQAVLQELILRPSVSVAARFPLIAKSPPSRFRTPHGSASCFLHPRKALAWQTGLRNFALFWKA